jgi:TatA/E family protein of Tat protein translocase
VFNIGPPEFILILLVALLVVGPKRLPDVGKTIGRSLREFRKAQDDLKNSFNLDDEPEAPRRASADWAAPKPTATAPAPDPDGGAATPNPAAGDDPLDDAE